VDGGRHRPKAGSNVEWDEQDVVASLEGVDARAARVPGIETSQSAHVQGIGEHDSLKSELLPEQVLNNFGRGGGDVPGVWIQRRNRDMSYHDGVNSTADRLTKGGHFYQIQVIRSAFYLRYP